MHRDRLARFFRAHDWDELPDGSFFLQELDCDWVTGTIATRHLIVTPDGERVERRFVHHTYTPTEWDEMLAEAGFTSRELFGSWDGLTAPTPEARLIVRAR